MGLEAVSGAGQRQAHHPGVIDQRIDPVNRVGELSHAREIGKIEVSYLDVAGHAGCGLLGFRDGAAGDDDAVTGSRERGCRCRAYATVAARDDDLHPAIFQSL
jgi:hypothetical protein